MKVIKKNQIVIFVIALMFITAGYLNFANQNNNVNLLATSSLADSEQMAAIGDAQLVSANEVSNNNTEESIYTQNNLNSDTIQENIQIENENISETSNNQTLQQDNYFTQSRLDRENMYSQMLENYQKILETDNLSSTEKTNAQNEIKRINDEKNAIMIAENLIKTKGFSDAIIFANNGNITVIVQSESLNEQVIAQIQNIITRELNVKPNKINISNKN